ncbi:MAG: DDE-type integrase/transposase/recombinase [Alicyclobacillus sp.]|nr:DDE-type integrase/transposase/recombinase [Alicyclobacillus sp.]
MQDESRRQIALFRYGLIAPILRQTEAGSQKAMLEELAKREYEMPNGEKRRFSERTLERYLASYRKGGVDGLLPQPRADYRRPRVLPAVVIERAVALRKEQPLRTVEQIILMLESEGLVPEGFIRRSTLAAHLRKAGVERAKTLRKQRTWQRYTANEVHEIWQCDVCDSLRVADTDSGGQMRVARLVAVLDDKSRYICYAAFYFRENLPALEDALKKAITIHGTPKIFYCDNAKIYQSQQLAEVAARLGFEMRHSRPFMPQGRGKLERFFGYVERSFRPEAELCVKNGTIQKLDDLNGYFRAWLEKMYHQRTHSTLKKRPAAVLATHGPLRLVEPDVLEDAFQWTYTAKVDKTACISVQGNTYEVEPVLVGQTVSLRYNPFDLARIQVWLEGKRYADAVPLKMRRHTDKRVTKADSPLPDPPAEPGTSFLETITKAHEEQKKQALGRTSFARAMKAGERHDD